MPHKVSIQSFTKVSASSKVLPKFPQFFLRDDPFYDQNFGLNGHMKGA